MAKKYLLNERTTLVLDGPEFRRQRREADKTLAEVAEAAGISISYLCDIERGFRTATGSVAEGLAKALEA